MPVISESYVLFFFFCCLCPVAFHFALCSLDAVFCLAVSHLLTCLLAESAITGALQLYTAMSSH